MWGRGHFLAVRAAGPKMHMDALYLSRRIDQRSRKPKFIFRISTFLMYSLCF